jgi:hypothetical protein
MKLKIAFIVAAHACSVSGQGTFQNLNFEQANPVSAGPPYLAAYVTTASALPNWQVFYGTTPVPAIIIDVPSIGGTSASLIGPPPNGNPIDGNYSVLLQGGVVDIGGVSTPEPALISQTGQISPGTESLLFKAVDLGPGPLDVEIGSQNISFTAVGAGPNYTLYGANISAWAGQTEELTFSAPYSGGINNWELDDISFSPSSIVPEPDPLVLTGMGGLFFALYRRFKPKRP